MKDMSLHILDIAENSLRAGAKNIKIRLVEHYNCLTLEIEDDGNGIKEEILENVKNPFYTTKNHKRFGLGLALLQQAADEVGGDLKLTNGQSGGIKVTAKFVKNHIDLKPVGDIDETIRVLKASHPEINISFEYITNNGDRVW